MRVTVTLTDIVATSIYSCWALEMLLVWIDIWYKCKMHRGFCKDLKNIKYLIHFYIDCMLKQCLGYIELKKIYYHNGVFVVQLLSPVWLFVTLWIAVHQASMSFTISWSLLRLMSIELVMPSDWVYLFVFTFLNVAFRKFKITYMTCYISNRADLVC